MVFYPALIIFNFLVAIIMRLLNMKQATIYKQIVVGQVLLFVPLVVIISGF